MKLNYTGIAFMAILNVAAVYSGSAQDASAEEKTLNFSGYAEAYYSYDFNKPLHNARPAFIYSHNRVNEVTINLAFIKAAYDAGYVRANIALAAGTYMNANYSAEPGVLKNIYEANAGVKLSKKHDLWVDAGIMPSHIGFESAIGKDNWTLTRGLAAENSPYFETGAKISYTSPSQKWYLAALYLNGWQRIQRPDGNSTPAFGMQLTYKPSSKTILNYSNFCGSDKPDSTWQLRYFHNLYGIFQLSGKWAITTGCDFGMEQKAKGGSNYSHWYAPVLMVRYLPSEKTGLTARIEYFNDKNGVIVGTGTPNGFQTAGLSAAFDYNITSDIIWRLEIKNYNSRDDIFVKRNSLMSDNNLSAATALAISF